jgi:hypothetical protein
MIGKVSKGYVPYAGHGPHNVCINPHQVKKRPVYHDKDTLVCSGRVRGSWSVFTREGMVKTGLFLFDPNIQWGECSEWKPNLACAYKARKPKNPSLHKGRVWGQAAKSVIIERK